MIPPSSDKGCFLKDVCSPTEYITTTNPLLLLLPPVQLENAHNFLKGNVDREEVMRLKVG